MSPVPHPSLPLEGNEPQAQKVTHRKSWLISAWVWIPRTVPLQGQCSCPALCPFPTPTCPNSSTERSPGEKAPARASTKNLLGPGVGISPVDAERGHLATTRKTECRPELPPASGWQRVPQKKPTRWPQGRWPRTRRHSALDLNPGSAV